VNRRGLVAVTLAVALLAPAAAYGQEPPPDAAVEARLQYNQGTQAYKEKKFVEAALHFEAAAAQRPHAVTLYTAALAWEQANKPERAADDFVRALEVPGLSAQQATNARDRVAGLEKTLGTALVVGPEGIRVQLEGQTEVAIPARLHGVPGVHKLLVRAAGRPVERRDVTLEVGQFTRVEVDEPTAPTEKPQVKIEPAARCEPTVAAPTPPPPSPAPFPLKMALGLGALGLGVATLAAGAVLGTQALDAKDAYDAAPTRAGFDHAMSLQTWTTIAFVAGGVFTAGGVVLLVLPDGKAKTTALAISALPGGVRLGGQF
jgi:hypothetical protein